MPKFTVPVVIEINGSIDVEADSPEEAIKAAKREYDRRREGRGTSIGAVAIKLVDGPDIDVDFACGDDPDAVQAEDEEDDN